MSFESKMFFESWAAIGRTLVVGLCAYVALVALLRLSGNRTLSKLNAFDLVVTVALGSTLASVLTSNDVALAQGVCAFALLIVLQFVVTWASVRSDTVDRIVKAEPVLLVHRGQYLDRALRRERITKDEVVAAVRQSGKGDVSRVGTVVLESDGSLSVITTEEAAEEIIGEEGTRPAPREEGGNAP